jgi:RNA polymerase sigma factor (sigma-70 family)
MSDFDGSIAELRRRLREYAQRRLPCSEQEWGSDFVQDAFVEAQERAELVRQLTPQQTRAWLFAVLRRSIDCESRARRRLSRGSRQGNEINGDALDAITVNAISAADTVLEQDVVARVELALATVTESQRLAIVLRYFGTWTLEEIGEQMEISRQSALGLIVRGLHHLEKSGFLSISDLY